MVKPEAQPVEKQKPEDPQVSEEPVLEPSSSEQKLDSQPEPTVTFLFTLLSTAEPTESKDPEKASDIQECQFLDKEDWGPRRTSREISHLQNDCRRLRESLSTIQADNRALREKLQNLLTVSYDSLKREAKAFLEEVKAAPEDARAFPEDAQAIPGMALSQVHWQHPHGTRGERTCLPQPVTQLPLPVATQLPEGGSVHPTAWCSHDPQIPVSALAGPKAGD